MNLRPGKPLFRACRSALSSSKLLVFLVTAALALGVVPSQLVSEATAASTDPSDGETTSSAAPKSNPMEIPTPPTVTEIPEDFPTEAAVAEATKTAPEAPTGPVNRDPMPVMRVDPDNPDSLLSTRRSVRARRLRSSPSEPRPKPRSPTRRAR